MNKTQLVPGLYSALRISSVESGLAARLRSGWQKVLRVVERQRQRARLRVLDDHLLKDIGLTREQADREANKPPWID